MKNRIIKPATKIVLRVLLLGPCLAGIVAGQGGAMPLDVFLGDSLTTIPIQSYQARQFTGVVRQQYDFSCGSAAVATLLQYHYAIPKEQAREANILRAMYKNGDQQKITKQGFSLLDMKQYLASIGMKANGYTSSLDTLQKAGIPAIVLINNNGYLHFVVIKGLNEKEVLIGDPAAGLRVLSRADFTNMWNDILFVVLSHGEQGKAGFNKQQDWRTTRPILAFDSALSNEALASFTVNIPTTPHYLN